MLHQLAPRGISSRTVFLDNWYATMNPASGRSGSNQHERTSWPARFVNA